VVDVGIYGGAEEDEPKKIKDLKAEALGPDRIKLTWKKGGADTTFFFRVYRAEGGTPGLDPEHLVDTTCQNEIIDHGLSPGREYHYLVLAESFGGKTGPVSRSAGATTEKADEFARFTYRGVVEGFYNDPWPHHERLKMIAFLEDAGMNYYFYAPKVEPYHRQWWRRPYPEAELKNFAELVAACKAHGVTFNYGISPGLDMNFKDPEEIKKLKEKLKSLFEAGVRAFTVCFDDIDPPGMGTVSRRVGERQAGLINDIHRFLKSLDPGVQLFFVPTVYSKTYSHWKKRRSGEAGYLEALAKIDPEVGIMWTGPGNVFSKKIDKASAMELKELWGRPVLIWDNYPVNDVSLRFNVFTGPYLGRAPDLGEAVGGIFLNPMYLPNASRIALYTAGKYMTEPDYDPWAAYDEALRFVGGGDAGYKALKTLADTLLPHPVFPELSVEKMPVFKAAEGFWEARRSGEGVEEADRELREMFKAYESGPKDIRDGLENHALAMELTPASEKLAFYGEAGRKCLDLMKARDPEQRAALQRDILELQARSRINPWHVSDEITGLAYSFIGIAPGRRNVLDDFINRAQRELPL
jgi:hypothetical protein